MSLTTETKVKAYLGISSLPDPLTSAQLDNHISAVGNFINNYCNRKFEDSDTVKYYDGNGTKELLIDDLISLTKIEILDADRDVDETLDNSDYYWLYPENKTPKNKIVIDSSNAPIGIFSKGHQNIKVTGTFGYQSSVPDDIALVATKLVAGIIEEKYIKDVGNIETERLGEYSVTVKDIEKSGRNLSVFDILDRYRYIKV